MVRPQIELYDLETGRKLSQDEVLTHLAPSCVPWPHDEENCPCDEHVQ